MARFRWYKKRCYQLPSDYNPADWGAAIEAADQWGEQIPLGVIYRNDRPPFEKHFPVLNQGPLVGRDVDRMMLKEIMEGNQTV